MAPIDGENISEQCRNDSQRYIDILNSVSKKNLDLFMILLYKNIGSPPLYSLLPLWAGDAN